MTMLTDTELERWRTKQIHAAISRGVNPIDAQNAVTRFLAKLPAGADPNTYVAPAFLLEEDLSSKAVAADVRAHWYGGKRVPSRFKRLLDAASKP
jgi:hypothetical protein